MLSPLFQSSVSSTASQPTLLRKIPVAVVSTPVTSAPSGPQANSTALKATDSEGATSSVAEYKVNSYCKHKDHDEAESFALIQIFFLYFTFAFSAALVRFTPPQDFAEQTAAA